MSWPWTAAFWPTDWRAHRYSFSHQKRLKSFQSVEPGEFHRFVSLQQLIAPQLAEIVARAPRHDNLTALLSAIGVPETSARFRMHKKRLPPPSRWFQVARALHGALRIQAAGELLNNLAQ